MTVGSELRQARERAGLSAEQLSERTKIQLFKVEALENGNFERLPQGIYLDGIVRAYAHELGIAHEPLVERVRLERGTLPGDWPVPFAVPIDLHGPASPDIQILDVPDPDDPLASFTAERELETRVPPVPLPAARQRAGLALPVLVLMTAAGVGTYLYRTTPFLERERERTARATSSAPQNDPPVAYSENELPADIPAPAATSNVTGSWRLATQVESSSYARFSGLKLGYEVKLEQDGERVKGVGRKVSENGAGISRRAQTPLTVSGTIDGDRLLLNFVERGARRRTRGKFELLMDESGTLRGSFSSTAARSSGRVEAHRVSTQ